MAAQETITIIGSPLEAWLAASIMARFAPLQGTSLQILETGPDAWASNLPVARPEMTRTHVSIGLDLKKLGAKPVQTWAAAPRGALPFGEFGMPLNGVSFVSIWHRARQELGETRPLEAFASHQSAKAFELEPNRYAAALKAIGTRVGVQTCSTPVGRIICADAAYETDRTDAIIKIGASAFPLRSSATLRLQALHESVLALIACLPWRDADRALATQEYENRLQAMCRSVEDMQTLLWDDIENVNLAPRLEHRLAVWRALGRVAPIDHDLFKPQEWMAAFVNAGVSPQGCGRLAYSLSLSEIEAHLDRCARKEAVHAD